MYTDNMNAAQTELYRAVREASNARQPISPDTLRRWKADGLITIVSVQTVADPRHLATCISIALAGDKGIANVIIETLYGFDILTDEGKVIALCNAKHGRVTFPSATPIV